MRNDLPDTKNEDRDETGQAGEPGHPASMETEDFEPAKHQGGRGTNDTSDESSGTQRVNGRRGVFPSSGRGRAFVVGVVALVLVLGGGTAGWQLSGLPENAAFAYGDRVVSQDELDARVQSLRALYGVEPPADASKLDGFRRDVAKSVAVSMILDRAGEDRKIVVSDKQARDVLDRYVAGQFGEGGRDEFVRALGNVGTSERAVLDEIKRQIAVGRLMDQVIGEVSISDDDLRREFDNRKQHLGVPERRVVRNLVVGSEQEGNGVLEELKAGTPIETVAAARSLDASSKKAGGMLGELTRDQLEGPVADAAFAAPQGGVYGPVPGRFGWNVGRIDQVLHPVPPEFAQVRDSLRQTLQTERSLQRWREWLSEQIRSADVEYAPNYQPANPYAAPDANTSGKPGSAPGTGAQPR